MPDSPMDDQTMVIVINRQADEGGTSYRITAILDGQLVTDKHEEEPGVNYASDLQTALHLLDPHNAFMQDATYVG